HASDKTITRWVLVAHDRCYMEPFDPVKKFTSPLIPPFNFAQFDKKPKKFKKDALGALARSSSECSALRPLNNNEHNYEHPDEVSIHPVTPTHALAQPPPAGGDSRGRDTHVRLA